MVSFTALATSVVALASIAAAEVVSPAGGPEFLIKSVVTEGDSAFNDLFLFCFHTQAGQCDGVFTNNLTIARQGGSAFFQGSGDDQQVLFDFGTDQVAPGLNLFTGLDGKSESWFPATIDSIFAPHSNITATDGDLTVSPSDELFGEFAGWLICSWVHEAPQLFWFTSFSSLATGTRPIATCAEVKLQQVFL